MVIDIFGFFLSDSPYLYDNLENELPKSWLEKGQPNYYLVFELISVL
jgi:hypothetical protein